MPETTTRKFNLREQPYVLVTVRAFRAGEPTADGARGISSLRFSVMDFEDNEGEHIGAVSAGHGCIVIDDFRREPNYEQEYLIRLEDVWDAFQESAAETLMEEEEQP